MCARCDVFVAGDALQLLAQKDGKGLQWSTLMRDWDPNRDGAITKMEFRQSGTQISPNLTSQESTRSKRVGWV